MSGAAAVAIVTSVEAAVMSESDMRVAEATMAAVHAKQAAQFRRPLLMLAAGPSSLAPAAARTPGSSAYRPRVLSIPAAYTCGAARVCKICLIFQISTDTNLVIEVSTLKKITVQM